MAHLGFNVSEAEEQEPREFDLIPDKTKLKMQIVKEEIKISEKENNQGVRWELEADVIEEGPYKNRKVWTGIQITNKDGAENTIGRALIRALWAAIGLPLTEQESSKAKFKPFIGTVCIEKGTEGYRDKNVIKYVSSVNAAKKEKVDTTPPFTDQEVAAASAPKKAPWKKSA